MANNDETVREVCAEMRYDHLIKPELIIARILAAYERDMAAKDAEITRLKAALKPVMELLIERVDGLDSPDGEFMTSSEYGVCDADGNEVDNHSIASALNAVREAQRIMKEGEVK